MKRFLCQILFIWFPFLVYATVTGNEDWNARISSAGHIVYYRNATTTVPFRVDSFAGPAWEGVVMKCADDRDSLLYIGNKDGIEYTIRYVPMPDHLAVECTITNNTDEVFTPHSSRLFIGIDSEMYSYGQWDNRYFPTLMRCERDFAWGYFMSPRGGIMAVGCENPVASYSLEYIFRNVLEWKWGHRIFTGAWDMLHTAPLPPRHPHNLDRLQPHQSLQWIVHVGIVTGTDDVKPSVSRWIKAPMVELESYTISPGKECRMNVNSVVPLCNPEIVGPDSVIYKVSPFHKACGTDVYTTTLPRLYKPGVYTIYVTDTAGKRAESTIYVRHTWSWYLSRARDVVARYPPLMGNSCEQFYGYYTAFLAARHFPSVTDTVLADRFIRDLPLLVDIETGLPADGANDSRIQNFSSVIGMLVDLYEAKRDEQYLSIASRIGDYLCSPAVQLSDGSYRSGNTHYTAVIYPAKSMLELTDAEKKQFAATADSTWLSKAIRHHNSAMKAIEDLAVRLDNIATEGDMTFEDGMISCSALQLALGALCADNMSSRDKYLKAAEYMLDRHRCLEQNLIPDARMRGATLRYWEALDIYFTPNQVMNSPHGWTAWKIYAVYYMYLLTGDIKYLKDLNDTLGACVQLMTEDGHLRWGFIPDPYVNGQVCIPSPDGHGLFQYADSIIGEQYLDMISPWMRPDDEHALANFGGIGGAGDHTVHEIFKALEEVAVSTAYIRVNEDEIFNTDNSEVTVTDDVFVIKPAPEVEKIHVYTESPLIIRIFGSCDTTLPSGGHIIPVLKSGRLNTITTE